MSTTKKGGLELNIKGRYGVWRLLNLLILGVICAGVFLTFFYIYQNIYSTLYNSNIIINLRTNAAIYELDVNAYEKARAAIEKKKIVVKIPGDLRNVFSYKLITTSTNATSTKQ